MPITLHDLGDEDDHMTKQGVAEKPSAEVS